MKRWVLTIILFLLLGAIVNVAVAWGCAAWSRYNNNAMQDYSHPGLPNWIVSVSKGIGVTRVSAVPDNDLWDISSIRGDVQIPAWSRTNERPSEAEFADRTAPWIVEHASGWPVRAGIALIQRNLFDFAGARIASSRFHIVSGFAVLDDGSTNPVPYRVLPVRPLWPGFAINTVFYALVLWLLFAAPFALRRWRRIKRGLCPKCAYPVGTSTVCTECGKALVCKRVLPR